MMNAPFPQSQSKQSQSLALMVIPPYQAEQENMVSLEAAMQSLVLDKRHPVALELAGTPERRFFVVRATTPAALTHVEAVLRSQYPQLEVRPLHAEEDPLTLSSYEDVSAVELLSGAASYLPMRTWQEEEGQKNAEGLDPLMGLLAALSKLPDCTRAVAQIGLVPAAANWSKNDMRKAVENALDPEKRANQNDWNQLKISRSASSSNAAIISFGIFVVACIALRPLLPGWLWQVLIDTIKGRLPHLDPAQIFQLILLAGGFALICMVIYLLGNYIRGLFARPMYDTRQVMQKTSRMAYHARIRLYAIGPKNQEYINSTPPLADPQLANGTGKSSLQNSASTFWQHLQGEREQAEVRNELLLRMVAAYRQFDMASGSFFVPKKISSQAARRLLSNEGWGHGWYQGISNSKQLITVDVLASLWHLPQASVLPELAVIEHKRSRTLLMPNDIARQSAGLNPIGYSEHGGYRLPFALSPQFFTLHTLIGGKSGEGKSTIMEHIARDSMKHGGLVLIDPHGDLVEHVLKMIPESRAEDVVLIDLSDREAAVGINPLDVTLGRGRDKAISDLLKTLSHIWETAWGPRMENAFEMALRTLFEANRVLVAQDPQQGPRMQYTLLDVLPLLTNENFCHALLQQIADDFLHRWWREYYEPMTLMQQRDVINPVISKVAKFEGVLARRIIGQSVSTLNFSELIRERKIILMKLARGLVGSDIAAIVGVTLLGLIQITLEEQGVLSNEERARFPIIIDEFQVMAGMDYAALAELRKYGATFFLATQSLEYLQKLDPVLLPTVLANVKQLIIFHMSAQDSEVLYQEMGVEAEDILNLDMHTCYIKMPSLTRRQPTFSLKVSLPPQGDSTYAESIRTRSRIRYSSPNNTVDEMLREAMIRSIRLAPAPVQRGKRKDGQRRNNHMPTPPPVIELPAATSSPIEISSELPTEIQMNDTAVEIPRAEMPPEEEVRKRRNRGRRANRRSKKKKNQFPTIDEMTSNELSDELEGYDEDDDDDNEEMVEVKALHKGNE